MPCAPAHERPGSRPGRARRRADGEQSQVSPDEPVGSLGICDPDPDRARRGGEITLLELLVSERGFGSSRCSEVMYQQYGSMCIWWHGSDPGRDAYEGALVFEM